MANNKALKLFNCTEDQLQKFSEAEPLSGIATSGYICKKDGIHFGSILFSKIDGKDVEQVVYGVPKMWDTAIRPTWGKHTPTVSDTLYVCSPAQDPWEYIAKGNYDSFVLANKWCGSSITLYRLNTDHYAWMPRGRAFIDPGQPIRDLTISLFESILSTHHKEAIQSITFELCGSQQPNLVRYEFELAAQPLFVTLNDGQIKPISLLQPEMTSPQHPYFQQGHNDFYGEEPMNLLHLKDICQEYGSYSDKLNTQYQQKHHLVQGYGLEHFAVEGLAIYLLKNGKCSRNSIYKCKSNPTSRYHRFVISTRLINFSFQFDASLKTRALEAVDKLNARNLAITESNLRAEMTVHELEWQSFKSDILHFAFLSRPNPYLPPKLAQKVLILVGVPASGKSTVASELCKHGWGRVNQDEMRSKKECLKQIRQGLQKGQSMIVDRCNFDFEQRREWILVAAEEYGVTDIHCWFLDIDRDVCKARIQKRTDHPTIKDGEEGIRIIDQFATNFVPPHPGEGFVRIVRSTTEEEVAQALEGFKAL